MSKGVLTFNRGKFFRDGKFEALEFGNKDQLKMIDKVKELQTGVLFTGVFVCPCGAKITKTLGLEEYETCKCHDCGNHYEWFLYDDKVPCIRLKQSK